MRCRVLLIVALAALVVSMPAAQSQAPQEPASGQVFRAAVDLVEVDVSVLDKSRRPITDLTQDDFTILEDGKPQTVRSFAFIAAAVADPTRSARMSFVVPDVADNNLAERVGNGRAFAIVLDDMNLPADDSDIVIATRDAARHVVDLLGPSDQAAIVYVNDAGKTQDFTNDKRKLFDAIDQFVPNPPDYIEPRREYQSGGGGDLPYRYSPVLARSACLRDQPAVPTLDAVTNALIGITGKRKTILFFSPGLPMNFSAGDKCGSERADIIKGVFRKAQRANINVHAIDPSGYNGYRDYIEQYRIRNGAGGGVRRQPVGMSESSRRLMTDFLKTVAENTGGRYVVDTDAVEPGIDRIFEEESAYYLLGYETPNNKLDGKFRKIEVKVNRPGASVRHRTGYWGLEAGALVAQERKSLFSPFDFEPELSGLTGSPPVSLRGVASALGWPPRSSAAGREPTPATATPRGRTASATGPPTALADVVVALSVRWPTLRAPGDETLTLTRNVYDPEGRVDDPVREVVKFVVQPGNDQRQELIRHLSLPPGRHQIRYSVASALLDKTGTVYVDVDVPDFSRSALALSGIVLGAPVAPGGGATGATDATAEPTLAAVDAGEPAGVEPLPVEPTSSRDFANGASIRAFLTVSQAGDGAAPVAMTAEILDAADRSEFADNRLIPVEAFTAGRGVPYTLDLPLGTLSPGPHLLSVAAKLPNGRTVRRDLIFRVR